MKALFDFFPVLAFFIAYYVPSDRHQAIFIATGAAIIAAIIQVATTWIMYKKVEKMHVTTLVIILILGGATLLFHDKRFFFWKPTVVNWLFAAAFLISEFIGNKSMVQRMMDHAINLPGKIWKRLNRAWIIFFITMGALNLYVAFNFAENIWVNFKLFGMLGITVIFAIIQAAYLSRYMPEMQETKE